MTIQRDGAARPRRGMLVVGVLAGLVIALLVTVLDYLLVANAWASCLFDTERYGFALLLSTPVLLLVNAAFFGIGVSFALVVGRRVAHRATRFGRAAGIGVVAGIVALALALAVYVEPAVVYFGWTTPEQFTECTGNVPSWWVSWR